MYVELTFNPEVVGGGVTLDGRDVTPQMAWCAIPLGWADPDTLRTLLPLMQRHHLTTYTQAAPVRTRRVGEPVGGVSPRGSSVVTRSPPPSPLPPPRPLRLHSQLPLSRDHGAIVGLVALELAQRDASPAPVPA